MGIVGRFGAMVALVVGVCGCESFEVWFHIMWRSDVEGCLHLWGECVDVI